MLFRLNISMVKFYFIGIDGGIGGFINKYVKDGLLPNISQLIEDGSILRTIPSVPVDTPTNWATLMSGASSFNHGVVSFTTHLPGETPQEGQYIRRTQYSSFSKAEFLWKSMERAGLKPAVVNYPVGWPPQVSRGIVIGGLTPGGDLWRVFKPAIFSTVDPRFIGNWIKNVYPGYEKLQIDDELNFSINVSKIKIEGKILPDNASVSFNIFKDKKDFILKEGEWSDWIITNADGELIVFRIKLIRLKLSENPEVTVYVSQAFKARGWAYPAGLEDMLLETSGPWVEGFDMPFISDTKRPYGPTNLSPELQLEHASIYAQWFEKALKVLNDKTGYDGLIMHYHLIDSLNHTYLALLDRENPVYDEKKAEYVDDVYSKAYSIIDKMIGNIIKEKPRDSTVIITSDHGALPCWKYVSLEAALSRAGLMKYEVKNGEYYSVDMSRTYVFPYHDPVQIWVNLKDREKGGIVDKRDYDSVIEHTIDTLYSMKDPDNGSSVIKLALRKETWSRGRAEERFGDILVFFNKGYCNWDGTTESLKFDLISKERLEQEVTEKHDVAGHHTTYLPADSEGYFENNAFTIFSGSMISHVKGLRPELRDVAPTISYILNIPAPSDSDGKVIYEILK